MGAGDQLTSGGRPRRLPHLPAIDGLRALAVASVFAYHADVRWAPGGFLGVDVFFVISGYLITTLLLSDWREYAWIDLKRFWRRRALRLLPALLLLLVAVWVVVPFAAQDQSSRLRGDVRAALTYVSNWRLIFQHQSYFEATGRPPLLQHLWSLAVEEQFYLVWPLVLWFALEVVRRARRLVLWILAAAVGSAALMAYLHTPGTDPSRVYYGTDTRAGTILLGAALACVWAPWRWAGPLHRGLRGALAVIGLAALGGLGWSVANLNQFDSRLYNGGFLGVGALATVVVAVSATPSRRGIGALLGARPLVWLGRRSYGVYLFYWPVIMLTRAHYDVPLSGLPLLGLRAALTVCLAALSYRFVESPVRDGALGRLWTDVRRTVAARGRRRPRAVVLRTLALGVSVAAIATAAVVVHPAPRPSALLAALQSAEAAPSPAAVVPAPTTTTEATTTTVDPATTSTTVEPTTTSMPTTTTTMLPAAHVTGLGDSVLLEAKAVLESRLPDAAIDAAVARQFPQLLALARSLRDGGRLGEEVILQLGNNGPVTASQFDQIMEVFKAVKRVVVVNVKVPRPWEPVNNDMLADGVTRWPNAVLVDWNKVGSAHPDLFLDDGTHMKPTGVAAFVDLVLAAL